MIHAERPLVLGSSSPRRRDFLKLLGIPHRILQPSTDETKNDQEHPEQYVARMAQTKLDETLAMVRSQRVACAGALAADTVVTLQGEVFGKPDSDTTALKMLECLSGTTHQVLSAYSLWIASSDQVSTRTVMTAVTFRATSARELARYVAAGESQDKAGAYGIQGRGASLVLSISGSYTNVVGLPLAELVTDLQNFGLWPR
jgi:septum formation protein